MRAASPHSLDLVFSVPTLFHHPHDLQCLLRCVGPPGTETRFAPRVAALQPTSAASLRYNVVTAANRSTGHFAVRPLKGRQLFWGGGYLFLRNSSQLCCHASNCFHSKDRVRCQNATLTPGVVTCGPGTEISGSGACVKCAAPTLVSPGGPLARCSPCPYGMLPSDDASTCISPIPVLTTASPCSSFLIPEWPTQSTMPAMGRSTAARTCMAEVWRRLGGCTAAATPGRFVKWYSYSFVNILGDATWPALFNSDTARQQCYGPDRTKWPWDGTSGACMPIVCFV